MDWKCDEAQAAGATVSMRDRRSKKKNCDSALEREDRCWHGGERVQRRVFVTAGTA
jgi:hypothetical protein